MVERGIGAARAALRGSDWGQGRLRYERWAKPERENQGRCAKREREAFCSWGPGGRAPETCRAPLGPQRYCGPSGLGLSLRRPKPPISERRRAAGGARPKPESTSGPMRAHRPRPNREKVAPARPRAGGSRAITLRDQQYPILPKQEGTETPWGLGCPDHDASGGAGRSQGRLMRPLGAPEAPR